MKVNLRHLILHVSALWRNDTNGSMWIMGVRGIRRLFGHLAKHCKAYLKISRLARILDGAWCMNYSGEYIPKESLGEYKFYSTSCRMTQRSKNARYYQASFQYLHRCMSHIVEEHSHLSGKTPPQYLSFPFDNPTRSQDKRLGCTCGFFIPQ